MRELLLLQIIVLFSLAIRSISALCPQVCVCDIDQGKRRVRCEGGGISIPGNVNIPELDDNTDILIVSGSLRRRNTFRLTPEMFINKRFKEVHLSYSDMSGLPDRAFYHLSGSLEVLNLTWNGLKYAAENHFRNLSKLTHLHLDHNLIETGFSAMFNFLSGLKVLTITYNNIKDVPPRMGLALSKLEELDFSYNPIGDASQLPGEKPVIPDTFFQDLPALKIFRMANTSIDGLPWNSMKQNNLNLEEIDLSNDKIQEVRANQFSLLRNLKKIHLAGNPIRTIERGALQGLSLQLLNLSSLPASLLQPGIFDGARISYLDISYMGLTIWNRDTFLPIAQDLSGLNISGNQGLPIESRMFDTLVQLKYLTMRRMGKGSLPADFFNYQPNVLEEVDLAQNGFNQLEDSLFIPLQGTLMKLNLASNYLSRVPMTLNLPRIQQIDLSDNRLVSFPDDLASSFANPSSTLRSLRLNDNPWHCDCGVAGLARWLTRQDNSNGRGIVCDGVDNNFQCPSCQSPQQQINTPLDRLPPQYIESCAPADLHSGTGTANVDVIIAVVVCLIVLIIAILLLVLWYRNRLHSYRTYEEKRKDNDGFDQNGDAEVFVDETPVGPISKPKTIPPGFNSTAPTKTQVKGAESDV